MGAKLGCLLTGTKERQLIKDILNEMAAEMIGVEGKRFSFETAYNMLRKAGIEIDIESTAVLYMEEFDPTDDWFSTTDEVETRAGAKFADMLDKVLNAKPFTDTVTIGDRSPGAAAADAIMKMFADMSSPNLGVTSEMRLFQDKMFKAAKAFADKDINIDSKIEAIQKQIDELEAIGVNSSDPIAFNDYNNRIDALYNMRYNSQVDKGRISRESLINSKQNELDAMSSSDTNYETLKTEIRELIKEKKSFLDSNPKVKENLNFQQILDQAFMMHSRGYLNEATGFLNSVAEVAEEFKREINQYVNEAIASGEKDDAWGALMEKYAEEIINQQYDLLLSNKEITSLVKDALVKNGFAKNKKSKDGTTQLVFDWTKLTDSANDTEYLKEKVRESLVKYGFDPRQIDIINNAINREYDRLRADIIDKRVNELERKNKTKLAPEQTSKSKTLAKLYNMGWFESDPSKYEKILNDMLGLSQIDQEMFNDLEKLGKALNELYKNAQESDQFVKSAINNVNEQIANILEKNANDKSKFYRISGWLKAYMSLVLRTLLYTISNAGIANNYSGWFARFRNTLSAKNQDYFTKEASEFSEYLAKATRRDITERGGLQYGDLSSTYVTKGVFDTYMNQWMNSKGDNLKYYHQAFSWLTGRFLLDGQDSYFKVRIVSTVFNKNMIKIVESLKKTELENELRKKYKDELESRDNDVYQAAINAINAELASNKAKFREDAIKEINEQLYGDSFEKKLVEAKEIIDHANRSAGTKVVPDHEEAVIRLASDMIKTNLLSLKNVRKEHIIAAYNSAYKAGGYDLGHVPNNSISSIMQKANSFFSQKMEKEKADGNYTMAALWSNMHTLYNTVVNPFVGGGTNWLVMKVHGLGLGMARAQVGKLEKNKNVEDIQDLTTDEGLSKLTDALWKENKRNSQFIQGSIGMIANLMVGSMVLAGLAMALKQGDDEEEEIPLSERIDAFITRNKYWKKFYKELPIQYVYYGTAALTGNWDVTKEILGTEFERYSFNSLYEEYLKAKKKGETAEAEGKFGEIVGKTVGSPLPFMRFYLQAQEIAIGGKEDYSKSISFTHGFFKSGMINGLGLRPDPEYSISALPGVGEAGIKGFKELGVNNMEDMNNYVIKNGNLSDIAGTLRGMKKPDKNGKMIPIVNKEQSYIIEEIMMNNNKALKPISSFGFSKEQLDKLKEKEIYTVSQLWGRLGEALNAEGMGLDSDQRQEITDEMTKYMEKIEK